jgi:hypothetical protein
MDDRLFFVLRGELNLLPECKFEDLHERQEWIGAQLSLAPSTVRKWGTQAVAAAATLLCDYQPSLVGRDEKSPGTHDVGNGFLITADSPLAAIRRTYATQEIEEIFSFDRLGVPRSIQKVEKHLAIVPHVEYIAKSALYLADRRRGVTVVETGFGCSLVKEVEHENGAIDYILRLDHRIEPTDPEPYSLSFRLKVNSTIRSEPVLRYQSSGMRRKLMRLQFTLPAVPRRIWWFRCEFLNDTDASPTIEQLLPPSPDHFYFYDFLELTEPFYGLAWEWVE